MRCCCGIITIIILAATARPSVAGDADYFFEDTVVQLIELTFEQDDWYTILIDAHGDDSYYLPCTFRWEGPDGDVVLEQVGARFKGNSSFLHSGTKKSFKIDFNAFLEGQEFLDLSKINLNNNFHDPSLLREALFLEFMSGHMPRLRSTFATLTVNGEPWGVFTAGEQVNKDFCQRWFGNGEDGNLYKGEAAASLRYISDLPDDYRPHYEKKTNESQDDWSDLIGFTLLLADTPADQMHQVLPQHVDLDTHLNVMAASALFSSYDAYIGPAHNFYMYHRQDTGRWVHLNWDNNMAFGNFRNVLGGLDPLEVPITWYRKGGGTNGTRPFAYAIMDDPVLLEDYLRVLRDLVSGFTVDTVGPRIMKLAAMLRPHVAMDPYYEYSLADFDASMTSDVNIGPFDAIGLTRFIAERGAFVRAALDDLADRDDLRLNEVMAWNTETIADNAGDFDPWIEIINHGPGAVIPTGVYLSDDPDDLLKWPVPATVIEGGDFTLWWLDGEPGQGTGHATFTVDPAGGVVYLSKSVSGKGVLLDSVMWSDLGPDESWGRYPDGDGPWQHCGAATPRDPNVPEPPGLSELLVLNEFMADNTATIADEAGEYEDWIEILNVGDTTADLSGAWLSDTAADPMKWPFPEGTVIEPGEHLLVWADEDAGDGDLHADFKLNAEGEMLLLVEPDGVTVIDEIIFGDQSPDVSMGRLPDGFGEWRYLQLPTPGSVNLADPTEIPQIMLNELMSNNTTFIEDPDEPDEFPDWFELYNPTDRVLDLGGLFITDDVNDPGAWLVPDGVSISPMGHLLIWADDDPSQGLHHATFQLSSSGEDLVIFAADGVTIIDIIEFPALPEDTSWGRERDGEEPWVLFTKPTPGYANGGTPCPSDVDGDGVVGVGDILFIISVWGTTNGDANGDGTTGVGDLLQVIADWGVTCF